MNCLFAPGGLGGPWGSVGGSDSVFISTYHTPTDGADPMCPSVSREVGTRACFPMNMRESKRWAWIVLDRDV